MDVPKSQSEPYVFDASLFQQSLFKPHPSAPTPSNFVTTLAKNLPLVQVISKKIGLDLGLATTHNKLSLRKSFFDSLDKTCYLWVELPRELFELLRDLFGLLRDWYSQPEVGSGGRAGPQN